MTQTSFLNYSLLGQTTNHMVYVVYIIIITIFLNPKLGHGTCEIRLIPCACTLCTYIMYQPWVPGFTEHKQPQYQPVQHFTYWHVLGSFNNWKIIQLSHKAKSSG